jgi:Ser/Thr protein kinase RdoA (MazF antagonist)
MTINSDNHHPYDALTPDVLLSAVESLGICCDGRLLALNSYENRVYQVGVEGEKPVVVKFYRPNRWHNDSILEEHVYTQVLADAEIPVIAPTIFDEGQTLFEYEGFRFSIYPCRGGRWPELEDPNSLAWMGRFIARIHAIGATMAFKHRPTIDIESYGHESFRFLMKKNIIPADLEIPYSTLVVDVLKQIEAGFSLAGDYKKIRLHGDCHPGNILWTDAGPHFVDFDDARMGPAVQDIWMLLSGDREQMTTQLADILEGYTEFFEFDARELNLIEPLRTLRMINYSAWLARRWEDPSFPRNFPWFIEPRYWEEQILALREQAALMNEPALFWD